MHCRAILRDGCLTGSLQLARPGRIGLAIARIARGGRSSVTRRPVQHVPLNLPRRSPTWLAAMARPAITGRGRAETAEAAIALSAQVAEWFSQAPTPQTLP